MARMMSARASSTRGIDLIHVRSIGQEPTMNLVTKVAAALVTRRHDSEDGQGLAEYALILALIAIVAIIALIFLGGQVKTILSTVGDSI
jgi:pilus assembly protein Flp/PilA